jgi:hypothetical protein
MGLILTPLHADKVNEWLRFTEELNGPRKEEFADFNRRYNLIRHEAWLCETPAGFVVCALHEGPGAKDLIAKAPHSSNAFDKWFTGKMQELHGLDLSKPPPGKPPERKVYWAA